MKRKTRKAFRLSTQHAANALNVLIADGRIAAKDVSDALKRRDKMLRDLRQRLAALEDGAVSGVAQVRKALTRKAGRKKPRLSAATRATYRLQGKYMSALRPLSKQDRVRVKGTRRKSGVRVAIREARKLAK